MLCIWYLSLRALGLLPLLVSLSPVGTTAAAAAPTTTPAAAAVPVDIGYLRPPPVLFLRDRFARPFRHLIPPSDVFFVLRAESGSGENNDQMGSQRTFPPLPVSEPYPHHTHTTHTCARRF